MIKRLPCYAGATVLGDGGVALILDVAGIATMAGIELTKSRGDFGAQAQVSSEEPPQSMLIFTAGDGARCAVPVSMVARLEQVERSALEQVAGAELLQYRGELMPIIRPETALTIGAPPPTDSTVQQLLVFNFGRPVGVAVNEIIDTCDVDAFHPSDVPGTLGKAVIFGRTTLLVDVFSLVRQLAPGCMGGGGVARRARRPRVILADELDAMRASLAGFLRASGLDVLETSVDAVVRELRQAPDDRHFDAVVAGVDGRGGEMVKAVKKEQPRLPIVCVAREDVALGQGLGATCVKRAEREAVLEALVEAGIFLSTNLARAS
jgi:two-component system chemotaxis sensor kinase CheA